MTVPPLAAVRFDLEDSAGAVQAALREISGLEDVLVTEDRSDTTQVTLIVTFRSVSGNPAELQVSNYSGTATVKTLGQGVLSSNAVFAVSINQSAPLFVELRADATIGNTATSDLAANMTASLQNAIDADGRTFDLTDYISAALNSNNEFEFTATDTFVTSIEIQNGSHQRGGHRVGAVAGCCCPWSYGRSHA